MKPVLVLQNLSADGPAYLATWLRRRGRPMDVRDAEAGLSFPERIDGFGALALLGGEMSANDDLPSLRRAEALIRQAVAAGVPVLGLCLGAQLMARALGAAVTASPRPEIGWQEMTVAASPAARAWFGAATTRRVYHWHGESFGLPSGAEALARTPACPNQAYALGPHLGVQFHLELDAEKLSRWAAAGGPEFLRLQRDEPATVQSGACMLADAETALPAQQAFADAVFARWLTRSE